MTEADNSTDEPNDGPSFRRVRWLLNAYLSLGWGDRIGVAAAVIMVVTGGTALLRQGIGVVF